MTAYLEGRCRQEGLTADPAALALIARQATGSLRDAISLLDQLASTGEDVTLQRAETVLGTATGEAVRQVVEAIRDGRLDRGLTALNQSLDGGADPRQLARQIVDFLRNLLLMKMGNEALVDGSTERRREMVALASALTPEGLLTGIRSFHRAATEGRAGWQPGLALELALLESATPGAATAGAPAPPLPKTAAPPSPAPPRERSRTTPDAPSAARLARRAP